MLFLNLVLAFGKLSNRRRWTGKLKRFFSAWKPAKIFRAISSVDLSVFQHTKRARIRCLQIDGEILFAFVSDTVAVLSIKRIEGFICDWLEFGVRLANGFTGTDDEKPRNRKRRDATTTVSFDGGGRARHDEFKQDFFFSVSVSLSLFLFYFHRSAESFLFCVDD